MIVELNANALTFYPTQKISNPVILCSSTNIETIQNNNDDEHPTCSDLNNEIALQPSTLPSVISVDSHTVDPEHDPYSILNSLRCLNPTKVIFAHLNINSIRNKFDSLRDMVSNNIDILLISETKIDDSFPSAQFSMAGFSIPYRLDTTRFGGGVLLYVREDIPSKLLNTLPPKDIECVFIKLIFTRRNG